MIGSVIDKYEVVQKLGEGATATVYRGRHMAIGKDVAIKVLHPHLSTSARYRERFHREARAVGRLTHENIVSILDYSGQAAEDCYIVTELIDGMTLLALIENNGSLPSEVLVGVGVELAMALDFAHKAGVVHRDIKPENVMVRRDGVVKLMDFGVARVLDEGQITLDGSLLGSPAYMSPQQAMDEPLDGRTDLFSLGTVLFHAVTGHVPFAGSNASIILRNIIDGQRAEVLELNPQAAPALAAVIDKLLQTNPDDRYPNADEAAVALQAVLTESGLTPGHPRINLRAWLVHPKEVEGALTAHLQTDLLDRGKARLQSGDTVGALQLFNRLLAVDENHAEVLALIQSLHAPPASGGRIGRLAMVAAAGLLLAGVAAWVAYPGAEIVAKPPAAVQTPVAIKVTAPSAPSVPAVIAPALPSLPAVFVPASTAVLARPVSVRPEALRAVPAAPGQVVLERLSPASVWVDGKQIGQFRGAIPVDSWVGTRNHPILLTPGPHQLELRNPALETFARSVNVAPGESLKVSADVKAKPTKCLVNAGIPDDCLLTAGGTAYGKVGRMGREFSLPGGGEVSFDCGTVGRFAFMVQPKPGSETIVPEILPPELRP